MLHAEHLSSSLGLLTPNPGASPATPMAKGFGKLIEFHFFQRLLERFRLLKFSQQRNDE